MTISPLRTSRFRTPFIIYWSIWACLHAYVLNWYGFDLTYSITDSLVSNLLLIGSCILISTILRYYIPKQQTYSYIIVLCFVLTGLWLVISNSILIGLKYGKFFNQSLPIRFALGFLLIGGMALISLLWYTLQDRQETELRQSEAEKLTKEAELYKLRQQLQPHFLFNSLNSINALIGTQPQLARSMIQQLSDFLRGTLRKEENQWVTLDEELAHLELYLEIEKVRFGHRLSTEINNQTSGSSMLLPSMILQPVVENAIKFGLYDTTGDINIVINATVNGSDLEIKVTNPYDPATSNAGTGFGLKSVTRRLYLLFARNDLLSTHTSGNYFITIINIPQK